MKLFLTNAIAAAAALALVPAAAEAAPCKDAHGKFVKCPVTAPAKATATKTVTKTVAKPAAVTKTKVTRTAAKTVKGHCRDAHGRFAKCGAPGSKPA